MASYKREKLPGPLILTWKPGFKYLHKLERSSSDRHKQAIALTAGKAITKRPINEFP